ncbi:MAG: hypothetical protein V1770_05940 [bacterium]
MNDEKTLVEIDNILDKLSVEQLISLNKKVVERIKILHKAKQLYSMSRFSAGDRVYFTHNGQHIKGTIIRLNQRTATVIVDGRGQWNISPSLLMKW